MSGVTRTAGARPTPVSYTHLGRPPKADKAAPDKTKPQPRDKMSQSKKPAGKGAPAKAEAPAATEPPPAPRDAARGVKEEIVYLNLSELHPFKNHPFGVRDDVEMQGLVESVKTCLLYTSRSLLRSVELRYTGPGGKAPP